MVVVLRKAVHNVLRGAGKVLRRSRRAIGDAIAKCFASRCGAALVLRFPKKPRRPVPIVPRRLVAESLESRIYLTANFLGTVNGNLSVAGNYSGAALASGDALVLAATTSAINNDMSALSVASLEYSANGLTLGGNALTLDGPVSVDSGVSGATLAADTAGALDFTGPSTLTLTGTNTFSSVTVSAGTLVLGSAAAAGNGSLTVGDASDFPGSPPTPPDDFTRRAPSLAASGNAPAVSAANVVFADGESTASADDFSLGTPSRLYGSGLRVSSGGLGNWMLADQPYAAGSGSVITIVMGPEQSYSFSESDGVFTGNNGIQETLSESDGIISFTETNGTVWQFNGLTAYDATDARNGQFVSMTEPGGSSESATALDSGASNQIATLAWNSGGASQPYQTEQLTYYASGVNAGRVETITRNAWNGSELVPMRMVTFAFYDGSTSNGMAGDLESATEATYDSATSTWTNVGTSYYRYAGGSLSLALSPQDYANAAAALGTIDDSTTTADLLPYSSFAYTYVAGPRVATATTNGLQNYTYAYTTDITLDFTENVWTHETLETRPDASTLSVFSNYLDETLLTDLADASGDHWVSFYAYGTSTTAYAGELTLAASPSAVDLSVLSEGDDPLTGVQDEGYDPGYTNLNVQLYADQGLITEYTYAASTSDSISDTTAGNVAGYLESVALLNGTGGTPVPQESYTYFAHTGDVTVDDVSDGAVTSGTNLISATIFPEASDSDFPDGATANITSFAYTWWDVPDTETATVQMYTEVTTLPVVATAQNGPGTAWTTETVFDPYGNSIWSEDADGYLSLNQYDAVSGLLMESVANVNTASLPSTISDAADTVAVPENSSDEPLFATLSGDTTNLNSTSDLAYDPLGRETLSLGPAFVDAAGDTVRTATFTTYNDVPQTSLPTGEGEDGTGTLVATESGFYVVTNVSDTYAAGDYVLVNPISIEISSLDGQVTDDLQAQDGSGLTVTETSSAAALTELASAAASPTSYSRWTYYDYATQADTTNGYYGAGQMTDMLVFTDIASGTADETFYRYSSMGWTSEVLDPSGTITETSYDVRGLTTTVYVGTSDGTDWPGDAGFSSTASNNMVEVTANQYDNSLDGGDGNLTGTTEFVGSWSFCAQGQSR